MMRTGFRLEYLSAGWMSVEVVGTVLAGVLAGSIALVAFGADSIVELLSAAVVLDHLRGDVEGSDAQGRNASKLTMILLFSLIPVVGTGAAYSALVGIRPEHSPLGIAIAIGAVIVMPYLWLRKRWIGREARCLPLSIDALESVACFLMAVALLGGLLAEWLLGLWWADYVATAVILAFVAREAIESYRETIDIRPSTRESSEDQARLGPAPQF
jgi:divalent metal cation (Fe/Co/Zn/Cd) transporter